MEKTQNNEIESLRDYVRNVQADMIAARKAEIGLETQERGAAPEMLSPKKRHFARHMAVHSASIIPETLEKPISWGQVQQARRRLLNSTNSKEAQLSNVHVIALAVSKAMFEFDRFRMKIRPDDSLYFYKDAHIGLHCAAEGALQQPAVVMDLEDPLDDAIFKIASAMESAEMDECLSDYDCTLSIASMAGQGITNARPCLVYPQVASLFIGAPFHALDQEARPARMANLVLTYDKRGIRPIYAAKFLVAIEKNIQNLGLSYPSE